MKLSIVHFSTSDSDGGSARSAYRIHSDLRRRGHRSRMLVRFKNRTEEDVEAVASGGLMRLADRVAEGVTRRIGLQYQAIPSNVALLRHEWLRSPDIVQLYNTHGGYFSVRLLPVLARRAPIVWRLSDMWPVTGHCAYAGDCERWLSGCGDCPDLATYPSIGLDTTAYLWRQKRSIYAGLPLTVVAPSSWTENVARRSPLFANAAVHRIPNGLDLAAYRPHDRGVARRRFGVPQDRRVMLFAPHVANSNPRKGTHLLEAALRELGARDDTVLLLAGLGAEQWVGKVPQQVVPVGYLQDDDAIALANAAADFVVVPSSVDNLPNSVIEAFACGRPVVAFDAGGIRDAVEHGRTGLLVAPADVFGFARALRQMLDDGPPREAMGMRALDFARKTFSAEVQGERFEALYVSLANEWRRTRRPLPHATAS